MHPRWRLAEKMEVQEGGCQPLEATWIGEELEDFLYRSRHRLAQRKAARLHSLGTPGTRLQRFSYTANSVVLVADRDRVRRISHGDFRLRAGNYLLRHGATPSLIRFAALLASARCGAPREDGITVTLPESRRCRPRVSFLAPVRSAVTFSPPPICFG